MSHRNGRSNRSPKQVLPGRKARPQDAEADAGCGAGTIPPSTCPQKSADERRSRGHGSKPEAVREAAILALLSEKSIQRAAAKAGLSERTLRRWLHEDEHFKAEYEAARWATYSAAMSRIQALTERAVDTLEDLLGATKHPHVRLGAARTIVEIGVHEHDAHAILTKLEELERRQQAYGK